MRNAELSQRIKELRTLSGSSQAELADNSKLSLRTIQRIENGEATPRGDTLKRLSAALNISPDELIKREEQADTLFLGLLNLSALSFIFFPLLGFIVPLILWSLKKDQVKDADETGKKLMNFEIIWCLLLMIVFIAGIVNKHGEFRAFGLNIGIFNLSFMLYYFLYAYNIVLIIVNFIRIWLGKQVNYLNPIRLIR